MGLSTNLDGTFPSPSLVGSQPGNTADPADQKESKERLFGKNSALPFDFFRTKAAGTFFAN